MNKIIISLASSVLLLANFSLQAAKKTPLELRIASVNKAASYLSNRQYADSILQVMQSDTLHYSVDAFDKVAAQVDKILDLQSNLSFIDTTNMRSALNQTRDFCLEDQTENLAAIAYIGKHLSQAKQSIYSFTPEAIAQAEKIIAMQREVMMTNPLLDMDNLLVSHYTHGADARKVMCNKQGMPPANYVSVYSGIRKGIDASIVKLNDLRGDIKQTTLYKSTDKSNIADLQLHWNADKALFSSTDKDSKWRIYEMDMQSGKTHEVVDIPEKDIELSDANYLPDGRIILSSTIGYNGVPCVHGLDIVGNLSMYNPKDKSFRRLTFDQDGNWNPVMMHNGRVMYTRWEYTDLTHYFSRIVMHMNPDGTENKALYGSGSYFPNSTYDMRPLPSSASRFIGVISGHHGVPRSGRLMIFDPAKSRKEEKGMVQEIPFSQRKIVPIIKDYLVDGVWPQFVRPFPLDDQFFLVSAKLHPRGLWGIYLVDVFDNMTCIAEFEGAGLNMPIPIIKQPTPPIIPDRVNLQDKEATIFIQDIYEGEGTQGVPRGTIKELRVFAYEYAYQASISDHDAQGIQSGWDIKRLLGTVPVEADGSVIFKAPANTPISLQPLDANGAAVQWMRSWFTPMPGETVSCIGCHEDQNNVPMPKRVMASQRKPHTLKAPQGGARSFTFDLEVQPILDRACVSCHNGEQVKLNLTKGRTEQYIRGRITRINRPISKSYLELMRYVYRQGPEADMYVLKPYEYHASNSELIRMLDKGHHNVQLTTDEMRTLYNWIDFNAPYYGAFYDINPMGGFDQYTRRIELANKYNHGAGVDWRKELSDYAAQLKPQTATMPSAIKEKRIKSVKLKGWPFDPATKQQETKAKTLEVAPGVSMEFVWIPAGTFVMGDNQCKTDASPAFKAKIKQGFWMSKYEVTNQQYVALVPSHDSRIIGQQWKDHTTPGYFVNKPNQPVVRVSQQEALAYCAMLSEKMEQACTLPSETEWEWACRAGSDQPFWFGDVLNFGSYENLADAQITNLSVTGVDPKPMSKSDPMRQFWDYMPRETQVDDKQMIVAPVGSYLPNPWGLHDMHGNVSEWTCSAYIPYPLKREVVADKVVARGGSWAERPIYSTATYRKGFLSWQKVHNVGFRVVLK